MDGGGPNKGILYLRPCICQSDKNISLSEIQPATTCLSDNLFNSSTIQDSLVQWINLLIIHQELIAICSLNGIG